MTGQAWQSRGYVRQSCAANDELQLPVTGIQLPCVSREKKEVKSVPRLSDQVTHLVGLVGRILIHHQVHWPLRVVKEAAAEINESFGVECIGSEHEA